MTKKLPKYKVPYSKGNLQHYANSSNFAHPEYGRDYEEWRENLPFEATMTIDGMTSGYSAKHTLWRDEQGRTYPMFVADVVDLLREAHTYRGTVTAKWIVRKRGQNYGIRFYEAI